MSIIRGAQVHKLFVYEYSCTVLESELDILEYQSHINIISSYSITVLVSSINIPYREIEY